MRVALARAADRLVPPALAGRMRVLRAGRAAAAFPQRIVEHEYAGTRHRVTVASPYGEMYDADWPALPEIELLRSHRLRPGARVFDLGANHGVVALMLADAVGPAGRVVAVEADPAGAEALARTVGLNGMAQLSALHAAVAEASGELSFSVGGTVDDGSGRRGRIRVPAYSIDALAERHGVPDVVFMDVEGYEARALAGASKVLQADVDWFVEVHGDEALRPYGDCVSDVLQHFPPSRYDRFSAKDELGQTSTGQIVSSTTFAPFEEAMLSIGRFFLVAVLRT